MGRRLAKSLLAMRDIEAKSIQCDICLKQIGEERHSVLDGPEIPASYYLPGIDEDHFDDFLDWLKEASPYVEICMECWDTRVLPNGTARDLAICRALQEYLLWLSDHERDEQNG